MSILDAKPIMIQQLEPIKALFRSKEEPLQEKMKSSSGSEKLFYKAILCFVKAQIRAYVDPADEDPLYLEGRTYMDQAVEDGHLDSLRLAVFVETGLSVKVPPKFQAYGEDDKYRELVESLYKRLYEETNDSEIPPILEDIVDQCHVYSFSRQDRVYWAYCDWKDSQKNQCYETSGSHDEAYYENIIKG